MSEPDPLAEIEAMRSIAQALQPLDDASRRRVITWASDKFLNLSGPAVLPPAPTEPSKPETTAAAQSSSPPTNGDVSAYASLADLFHACAPGTDGDKALVVGAWLQAAGATDGIDSFRVNSELKHLGYGIGNITRALQNLVETRPALMIQLRKSGTTKQARKTFRVTDAGMKRVKDLIAQTKASA